MRKGWKKAVSTMLCAAMILSMSSFMVSADDLKPTNPETPAEDATTEVPGDEKDPADEEKDPADEEKDPADEEKDPSEVPGGPEQPSDSLPMAGLTPATPAAENGIMTLDAQPTNTPTNEDELKAALTDNSINTITIDSEISISNPIHKFYL